MPKQAVVIYGPPGAGKGTQANLLAWTRGFIHFDTGKYLESVWYDPANQSDPIVKREKNLWATGKLNTPEIVLKIVSQKVQKIAGADFNIIFSGSPRTLFEAFGDKKNVGLVRTLTKKYGRENIFFFVLKVRPASSMKRNSHRLICTICKTPMIYSDLNPNRRACAICDGKLYKRKLDDPKIIKVRLKEYGDRTFPIIKKLKTLKYRVIGIDGEPAPHKVHQDILRHLE